MNFDDVCEKVVEKTDAFDVSLHKALISHSSFDFLKRSQQIVRTFQFLSHLYYGLESEKPYPETPEDEFEYFGSFPGEMYSHYKDLAEESGSTLLSQVQSHLTRCADYLGDHWLPKDNVQDDDIEMMSRLRSELRGIQKFASTMPLAGADVATANKALSQKGPSLPGI